MSSSTIVWFRQDLRLLDNSALRAAAERGPVIPVYLWTPEEEGEWAPGGAGQWWLHHALEDLGLQLKKHRQTLIVRQGESALSLLRELIKETGADAVYWNRRYEPIVMERDAQIKKELRETGLEVRSFNSQLLREPHEVSTQAGKPYQVYTPFARNFRQTDPRPPETELPPLSSPPIGDLTSLSVDDLTLLPQIDWAEGFRNSWNPTRRGAEDALNNFLESAIKAYDSDRDFPSVPGTSRLSPYLHWGQIGPREIWQAIIDRNLHQNPGGETYLKELVWREFAHHVLYHFPHTPTEPLRENFKDFPWDANPDHLKAWQSGHTGYPIVDAGMRQLWQTGWMHNRVRMIVGSFLVKHLLQPWQEGARWFWDTLVDADLASNTLGWQWSGGCGADAAPYFRVFNPITQAEKFDPDGIYIRTYVPELSKLSNRTLFAPWEASPEVLDAAGIVLGKTYPKPLVMPKEGRERALAAFAKLKNS
jgi:deoxyribodipyrimidine photo-lyase